MISCPGVPGPVPTGFNSTPAIISEGRLLQKITSLCQVRVSHYFWNDRGRLCASATVSRATQRANPYNDQASKDSAGNSIAWGTVPWKHPSVMRKGIRAINIKPRRYLTLFAWEADLPQTFSFSCIQVETKGFKSKPPVQEGWFLNPREDRTYLLQTHFN